MPQNPIGVFNFLKNIVTGALAPGKADGLGQQIVGGVGGVSSALYVGTGTPVMNAGGTIKSGPGYVVRANVIVAGAAGAIYDCIGTANATTANEIAVIPATQGPLNLEFPFFVGLTYVPGAAQVTSFSYQ